MARRSFLTRMGANIAAAAAPAVERSQPALRWQMVTSWPRNLDTLYANCVLLAKRVAKTTGRFRISTHAVGETVPTLREGGVAATRLGYSKTNDRAVSARSASRSVVIACAFVSATALGQTAPVGTAWGDRERLYAHFERVAEVNLKALYMHCARESSQSLLGFEEAARCSIAGEVLKVRSFAGNFNALLVWWRLHRDDRIDEPGAEGKPVVDVVRRLP